MKVITPVTLYCAGYATSAQLPVIAPLMRYDLALPAAARPWPVRILK